MKKLLLGSLFAVFLVGLLAECSTLDKIYQPNMTRVAPATMGMNTVIVTNTVYLLTVTNTATGVITPPQMKEVLSAGCRY